MVPRKRTVVIVRRAGDAMTNLGRRDGDPDVLAGEASADFMNGSKLYSFCAPQVAAVVLNYLRDHPEMRPYAAADLAVLAITKAWNCQ
jgi:hypothetical protein